MSVKAKREKRKDRYQLSDVRKKIRIKDRYQMTDVSKSDSKRPVTCSFELHGISRCVVFHRLG